MFYVRLEKSRWGKIEPNGKSKWESRKKQHQLACIGSARMVFMLAHCGACLNTLELSYTVTFYEQTFLWFSSPWPPISYTKFPFTGFHCFLGFAFFSSCECVFVPLFCCAVLSCVILGFVDEFVNIARQVCSRGERDGTSTVHRYMIHRKLLLAWLQRLRITDNCKNVNIYRSGVVYKWPWLS